MYLRNLLVNNVRAPPEEMVDDLPDGTFIPGYHFCRKDDRITVFDLDDFMLIYCNPRQNTHRLSLASRGNNDYLLVLKFLKVFQFEPGAVRDFQIPQIQSYLRIRYDTLSTKDNLPPVFHCYIDCLLDSMDIRCKGGNDDPSICLREYIFEGTSDLFFRECESALFCIGTVG